MAHGASAFQASNVPHESGGILFDRAGRQNVLGRMGTDETLESLHRVLEHQAFNPQVLSVPVVTFAPSPTRTRIRVLKAQTKSVPKAAKRRNNSASSSAVKKGIANAQHLAVLAGTLGTDLSQTRERLAFAKRAIRKGEIGRASYAVHKVNSTLRDAISSECELRYAAISRRIIRTAHAGGNVAGAKSALSQSKQKIGAGEMREAVAQLFESEKMLRDSQAELVLRILYDSKSRFMIANRAGLNIGPAVELVNESRRKLRDGEIEKAILLAKRGVMAINAVLGTHEKASSTLLMCNRAIGAAESVGVDVASARERFEAVTKQFKEGKYDLCVHASREIISDMKQAAHDRAAEATALADRAAKLARDIGIAIPDSEDYISMAREALAKDNFAKCIELTNLSMFRTNSMLAGEIGKRVRNIDQFAKGITGDLSSMTEVEKAIAASKERSLETVRKYANMTEELVEQAYDSAVSYTRVTQDVVKQACQDFLGPEGTSPELTAKDVEITSDEPQMSPAAISVKNDSQRLRIVDLYLRGRITDVELDRLLLMLDSGTDKAELI
ncbi:MAG: hypothetical protein JW880_00700 [Candidatus Thermoplasmatota archaeon]|nr:hypothetical protein [Candidatus Thermoplasmatota archaeon]